MSQKLIAGHQLLDIFQMSFGQLGSYEFLKDMVDAAAFHLVKSKQRQIFYYPEITVI